MSNNLSRPSGHLFVIMGDIRNINCDAWLLPTDSMLNVSPSWQDDSDLVAGIHKLRGTAFELGDVLAKPLPLLDGDRPLPIATAVPLYGLDAPSQLRAPLDAFFDAAAQQLETANTPLKSGRSNRLLAVPFFGTGGAGGDMQRGEIIKVLLEGLAAGTERHGVDAVLVLWDPAAYGLAQSMRRASADAWPTLEERLQEQVRRLTDIGSLGKLVPFMGAGTSVSGGGPQWSTLLNDLASEIGLGEHREALQKLGSLDQASLIQERFAERASKDAARSNQDFRAAIASKVALKRYGLAPALLASIPSDGAITLNYDELFETASADQGKPRSIIPSSTDSNTHQRWLLKLHGTVSLPDSIVLTRDDYLGFKANKQALTGLVQAHLMTHHMLFVGFGLSDQHFHEIIHDVRRAIPHTSNTPHALGTALVLTEDALQRGLWEKHLDIVHMSPADTPLEDAGRTLEIFLDMLSARLAANHTYLLAHKYEGALSDPDRHLRDKLLDLAAHLPEDASPGAMKIVHTMMASLGHEL
ncbi:SIR2 family protein [Paeniglutamicibacter sp. ABSL32-1]|uniref:SIR2 family NAD-dependent protein deacylase n=1 Tax=Paeniglutamicibacter quisquiliarum TaxID=2849498 RepID=UPI001C2DE0E6|nr:SIR2 family protein [Paeniglutamicibacter quisquiliarum]MBV1777683.1 SIR2 family protein [Paeniglutamicibacter quisquiliarum]